MPKKRRSAFRNPNQSHPASQSSHKTGSSQSSANTVQSKRVEASTRKAKLEVEMKFLEHELKIKRIQLMKDISLASAEEDAMDRILEEDKKWIRGRKSISEDKGKENHSDDVKPSKLDPCVSSFIPKGSPNPSLSITQKLPEVMHKTEDLERRDEQDLGELSAIRELISLQEKQTELSALIANQQKISSLPVQEPPVFSGNSLDYPTFVRAFDAIIESKVESNKNKLFFLNRYTTGKANEAVKGFVALNTDDGYKEAKKLLAERFGNPCHVAEGYKSQLREWPKVRNGDSAGIQALSDFLIRCKEVMKSMDKLNSSETLIQVSAKLPSYSGMKWCQHTHDTRAKTMRVITFSDLVTFVKEEAELATDPIFSPNNLKRE